jgi:hypothetical protein
LTDPRIGARSGLLDQGGRIAGKLAKSADGKWLQLFNTYVHFHLRLRQFEFEFKDALKRVPA